MGVKSYYIRYNYEAKKWYVYDLYAYLFQGSQHRLEYISGMIRIGCQYHSCSDWLKNYREIGKKAGYSDDEIEDYGDIIKYLSKRESKKLEK